MMGTALTVVGAVVLFTFAWALGYGSGKAAGKVEAYEQANDISTGAEDG